MQKNTWELHLVVAIQDMRNILSSFQEHLTISCYYCIYFSQRNCDSYEVCANTVWRQCYSENAHCQRNYKSYAPAHGSCMEYVNFN